MIDKPMVFEEAIRFLLDKDPNPQEWDAADWGIEKPAVRVRSFFSSRVESARFLDRAQGLIFDYMAKVRDDLPNGQTALRVGGREDFVMLMRRFMIEEGMAKPDEFLGVNQGDLTDIRSMSRLRLIFDTNVRQAYGYGQWRQGMKPAVRRAFPAARFVRQRGVLEPRPRHAAHINEVRLKTDFDWWSRYQNDPLIGGFGVPWGPYGFYSGMGQEDVSRAEAARLGLKVDTGTEEMAEKPLPGLNENIAASVRKMDPDTKRKLLEELRGGPKPRDPEEAGREAAAAARRAALERRGLPAEPTVKVIEEGDRIRLMESRSPGEGPPPARMTELNQPEISGPDGYPLEVPDDLLRALLSDIEDTGTAGMSFEQLEGVTAEGRGSILRFEEQFKRSAREHVRIFTPEGLEVYRKSGDPDRVPVDASLLPGNVVTHNHPKSTPPSIQDLVVGANGLAMESRICSERYAYVVRFLETSGADLVKLWRFLDSASFAAGQEWLRGQARDVTPEELAARRIHAALMELARRGALLYRREADVPFRP